MDQESEKIEEKIEDPEEIQDKIKGLDRKIINLLSEIDKGDSSPGAINKLSLDLHDERIKQITDLFNLAKTPTGRRL